MANSRTHYSMDMDSSGGEEAPLSEKELKAHKLLSKANPDTFLGTVIHGALGQRTNKAFRELIQVLKNQAIDGPEVMGRVIGEEGMKVLNEL